MIALIHPAWHWTTRDHWFGKHQVPCTCECCAADDVDLGARQPSSQAQPAAIRSQDSASASDSDEGPDDCQEPEEEVKVVLKLQCSHGTLNLRTRTQTAMRNLFEAYKAQAKQKGWISDIQAPNIKFMFEGETLAGNETAESLDLEGDEIIEVRW